MADEGTRFGSRPLGDLCTLRSGFAFKSKSWAPSGIPVIQISNVRDGYLDLTSLKYVSAETAAHASRFTITQGDILVAMTGYVGAVARAPSDAAGFLVNQRVGRVEEVDSTQVEAEFLHWALRLPSTKQAMVNLANGSAQANLSSAEFGKITIPTPPLPVQRRIAWALDALDHLVQNNQRLMASLDALGMVLFMQAWDGVTTSPIESLGELTMGQSPPGNTYNLDGSGMSFFQGVRDFGDRYPTARVFCTAPSREASAGDILIAVRAPIGDTNVAIEDTAIGRGVAALRAPQSALALRALRASASTWSPYQNSGTVFSSITGRDLRSARVPSVTDASVEETLSVLDTHHRACAVEISQVRATRDDLLPLLMSGRVTVRDEAVA
jgi:type I restriction enzyme S subunit